MSYAQLSQSYSDAYARMPPNRADPCESRSQILFTACPPLKLDAGVPPPPPCVWETQCQYGPACGGPVPYGYYSQQSFGGPGGYYGQQNFGGPYPVQGQVCCTEGKPCQGEKEKSCCTSCKNGGECQGEKKKPCCKSCEGKAMKVGPQKKCSKKSGGCCKKSGCCKTSCPLVINPCPPPSLPIAPPCPIYACPPTPCNPCDKGYLAGFPWISKTWAGKFTN